MEKFNGKAIKNPLGKAGEYSYWGCYFYVGCSNGCTYCYLKKGRLAKACGGNVPTLKKCFKDKSHALEVFEKELQQNLPELQKHGLFFSFTTDPFLKETKYLTNKAMEICCSNQVPMKFLSKKADWVINNSFPTHWGKGGDECINELKKYAAFGFTLTGHDELEPNASTNEERIRASFELKSAGFKVFFSFEPVIDFSVTFHMICRLKDSCDLMKIGLMSGRKYDRKQLQIFIQDVLNVGTSAKIYFKDSLLQQAGISRSELPANCVGRDYNMFNQ